MTDHLINQSPVSQTGLSPADSERRRELARFLPIWPVEASDVSVAGRKRVIRHLDTALRQERQRGKAGHWAYDLARHAALLSLYKGELAALRSLGGAAWNKARNRNAANRQALGNPDVPPHINDDSGPVPS